MATKKRKENEYVKDSGKKKQKDMAKESTDNRETKLQVGNFKK